MKHLALYTISLLLTLSAYAQEEAATVYHAKKYLDINIKSKVKFNQRVAEQQARLLKRLKKKEERFARKLKNKDSGSYVRYTQNNLTFDSISRIQKPDADAVTKKPVRAIDRFLDSLKGVKNFLEDKAHVSGDGPSITDGYDAKLNLLNGEAGHNQQVNGFINQRTAYLKNLRANSGKKIHGLKSIQKQTFYSNEKIQAYKQIADEPSLAEEKALEYLQGKEGFDQALSYTEGTSMKNLNGKSIDELEKMGFQTQRQVQENLQKKLGNNVGPIQQRMGGQIQEYKDYLDKANDVRETAKETKSSLKGVMHTGKPDFKVNPMRGLPLSKRIEYQYNWQTTRATFDGKPAVFSMAVMAGFKHTPRLSCGAGMSASIGLGTNWNKIKFTFEGIGLRTYAAWQWQYGIGAYAGYERMYKQAVFVTTNDAAPSITETPHNRKNYNEAVLIGLTKAYRINDKMNGSIQVLYDVWWKEKGLRSPIVLRFATLKN